jgi:hypothetical protein
MQLFLPREPKNCLRISARREFDSSSVVSSGMGALYCELASTEAAGQEFWDEGIVAISVSKYVHMELSRKWMQYLFGGYGRSQHLQHTRNHLLVLLTPWYIGQAFGTSDNGLVLRFCGLHVFVDCGTVSVKIETSKS